MVRVNQRVQRVLHRQVLQLVLRLLLVQLVLEVLVDQQVRLILTLPAPQQALVDQKVLQDQCYLEHHLVLAVQDHPETLQDLPHQKYLDLLGHLVIQMDLQVRAVLRVQWVLVLQEVQLLQMVQLVQLDR